MISMRAWPTSNMLAAELLKVRKRWMPYALLLLMVAGAAILIWLGGYGSWVEERNDPEFGYGQESLRTFALPWSLTGLLDSGQFWGAILVGILVASAVATEHGWGTVRQALIRGRTRSQYLTAKLLSIALIAAITLLLAFGVGVGFSVIATALADRPITLDVHGGPSVPDVALMVLRAGYGIMPYALLAFCLAVVGRSTTLGVVGILFFMFVEAIVLGILGEQSGWAADARAFLPGHNVQALLAANRIGSLGGNSLAPRDPALTDLPDPAIAALVLAAYCVGFLAIAFVIFQRRDINA